MNFNFWYLLNKPKLAMSALDDLVLGAWLLLIVGIVCAVLYGAFVLLAWWDKRTWRKRREKIDRRDQE